MKIVYNLKVKEIQPFISHFLVSDFDMLTLDTW